MTCEEKDKMKTLNQKYKDKFGFPFVICARLNKKEAILRGLELRCYNSLKVSMTSVVEDSEIQLTEYSRSYVYKFWIWFQALWPYQIFENFGEKN